jgi:hypothetical protein
MPAVEADAVIVDLEARLDKYKANMLEAIGLQDRFQKGWASPANDASASSATQRSSSAKKSASDVASAEEAATQRVQRTRKARVDAAVSEAAATKKAADDTAAAEEAAQARITAAVERGIAQRTAASRRGTGGVLGTTAEAGSRATAARQTQVMAGTTVPAAAGDAVDVAAEKEINQLAVDRIVLADRLKTAHGEDRVILADQLAELRLIDQLERAGVSDAEIALKLSQRQLAVDAERAALAQKQATGNVTRFAEGAGVGRSYGSLATVGGIAAAGVVAGGVAAIGGAVDFAKDLKNTADAVGLTTRQVQVYQAAAREAGVSTDQFRSGIGQLNSYLGRAKEGDEQAAKTFAALGVNIKNAAGAGDVLPTLIDRLSKIPDAAERAAIETRLFGEEGRKLDAVLSGGNERVGELADALEKTGAILSDSDIQKLDDISKKLAEVKAQLSVRIAEIVGDNSDAILGLVDSFARLANEIGNAVKAYERFTNFRITGSSISVGDALPFLNPVSAPGAVGSAIGRGIGNLINGPAPTGNSLKSLSASASTFLQAQPGSSDPKALANLFAPKPRKGKSPDQLAAEAEERTKRYNDQLAGFQSQQLKSQEDLTGDVQERAAIESQLAERALARQKADIDSQASINIHKGADPDLERARAATLKAAAEAATRTEDQAREQGVSADLSKQENDHLQTRLQIESELLDSSQAFARTSAERLAIQLRLLDIEKEQERANLQNQIDTAKPGTDLTSVQARLGSIDERYAARAGATREQNLSPGQQYARGLQLTSDTVQDSQVKILQDFNTQLDKSVTSALKLHGIFGEIVSDLVDMAIKQALIRPLANSLFGGSSTSATSPNAATGGLFGGILKGIGSLFGAGGGGASSGIGSSIGGSFGSSLLGGAVSAIDPAFLALPGLAGGGSFQVGGNGGIDRNLLSINGRPIVRVNNGETIAVVPPNAAASNQRVYSPNSPVTLQQTINVDGRNSVTPADFASQIVAVSADHANRVAAQAGAGAVSAAPARVQRVQTLGN